MDPHGYMESKLPNHGEDFPAKLIVDEVTKFTSQDYAEAAAYLQLTAGESILHRTVERQRKMLAKLPGKENKYLPTKFNEDGTIQ